MIFLIIVQNIQLNLEIQLQNLFIVMSERNEHLPESKNRIDAAEPFQGIKNTTTSIEPFAAVVKEENQQIDVLWELEKQPIVKREEENVAIADYHYYSLPGSGDEVKVEQQELPYLYYPHQPRSKMQYMEVMKRKLFAQQNFFFYKLYQDLMGLDRRYPEPFFFNPYLLNQHKKTPLIPDQDKNWIYPTSEPYLIKRVFVNEKNSNTIKKIGRIILDNIHKYRDNPGVESMFREFKANMTDKEKRDGFNLHHLRRLFQTEFQLDSVSNLRTTRRILKQFLRISVIRSSQMSHQKKSLYLTTLKCSALRCSNKYLGPRLEIPEE